MRRKGDNSEYHTGRLNISCPPSVKDRIAVDATERDLSISQFIIELYEQSTRAGTSEHLARVGLDVLSIKKHLVDTETHLRRSLARSQGAVDAEVAADLARLREVQGEIDLTLRAVMQEVKALKAEGC